MSSQQLPPPDDHEDVTATTEQLEQLLALKKELDHLIEGNPTVTQALAVRRRYERLWREVFRGRGGRNVPHAFRQQPAPHSHAREPESERPPWLHTTNVRYTDDITPFLRDFPGMESERDEE